MSLRRYLDFYRVSRGYWFAPKMFGFGATPVTWQGWLLTLAGAALVALEAIYVRDPGLRIGLAMITLIAFSAVAAMKTEGGWRWRWGPDR